MSNRVIDLEEFKVGLQEFGCSLEEHEISYLYHHIDANGNGELDSNEFAMFLASGGRKTSASPNPNRRRSSANTRVTGENIEEYLQDRGDISMRQRRAAQRKQDLRRAGVRDFDDLRVVNGCWSCFKHLVKCFSVGQTDVVVPTSPITRKSG